MKQTGPAAAAQVSIEAPPQFEFPGFLERPYRDAVCREAARSMIASAARRPASNAAISSSSAARAMAIAGSLSYTTLPRPRSPAIERTCRNRSSATSPASAPGLRQLADSPGMTWMTCSSASKRSAKLAAHRTPRSAVSERSVPTTTRRGMAFPGTKELTLPHPIGLYMGVQGCVRGAG